MDETTVTASNTTQINTAAVPGWPAELTWDAATSCTVPEREEVFIAEAYRALKTPYQEGEWYAITQACECIEPAINAALEHAKRCQQLTRVIRSVSRRSLCTETIYVPALQLTAFPVTQKA